MMRVCLITDLILKKLGFGEYKDGSGDFGYYRLNYDKTPPYNNLVNYYELGEYDEKDDECDGYCDEPIYRAAHYFSSINWCDIYFIHDLYLDIVGLMPKEFIDEFVIRLKNNNLYFYIEEYYKYNNKID